MPDSVTVQLFIFGNVQGVGYRDWMVGQARKRKLIGMVRNRSDGTVEAVIRGPQEMISDIVKACHEGPPAAQVKAIKSSSWKGPVNENGFVAMPTV
jgi:acylphosphatase